MLVLMMNRTSNVSVNAPINAVIKKYIPDGINKDVHTIAPTISVRMILIKIPPVGYDLRPV